MSRAAPEAGFTLIEMLVALALFALVGLAAFAMLDTVIRTRDRTEGRLETVADVDRALTLFSRDLLQSDPGTTALGETGNLLLSRRVEGTLRELSWSLEDGDLVRRARATGDLAATRQPLLGGVSDLAFRFLGPGPGWADLWPPAEGAAGPLRAVELSATLTAPQIAGDAPLSIRRVAEVPGGVAP